jgi:hypothetical protein
MTLGLNTKQESGISLKIPGFVQLISSLAIVTNKKSLTVGPVEFTTHFSYSDFAVQCHFHTFRNSGLLRHRTLPKRLSIQADASRCA